MADITPVVFENRESLKLFGMLHNPDENMRKAVAIIILSPGVKTRVAPHRLYNKMASQFVELGYPVFRFDFNGLGDAEGEIEEEYLADFYGTVQVGRYINDTVDAINWITKKCGVSEVILAGLCGGAITGLLAGADDDRVIGLLGLGIPVILDSNKIDTSRYISQGQLNQLSEGYLRKLANPRSLVRLLTFRSDFRLIGKVLVQMLNKIIRPAGKAKQRQIQEDENKEEVSNINQLFSPAFFKMADAGKKIFFIFSGADRLTWEFDEKFIAANKEQLEQRANFYELYTIADANHILSYKEWLQTMFKVSRSWLQKNFS